MFSKTDEKAKSDTANSSSDLPRGGRASSASPSIISPDLKVVGNLESAGDLQIDGTIQGDIKSRSVTVGESAHVKGAIVSDTARICGSMNGQIRAASVTLAKTARVKGDIFHQSLSIEAGAELEGQVLRLDSEAAKDGAQAARPRPVEPSSAAKAASVAGSTSNGGTNGKPAAGG